MKITEQRPDQRIAWTSLDGAINDVIVTIYPLSAAKSKVLLHVTYDHEEMSLRVQRDLQQFTFFTEMREHQAAA